MKRMPQYKIQEWLFAEAEGHFDIDLAESGIQYHFCKDLKISGDIHLNYSLDSGNVSLKERIAKLYDVDPDRVMITHGSQEALYLFYQSFLNSGDHVITFTPGWQQSWDVPRYIGADVTLLPLNRQDHFSLPLEQIEEAICSQTRLLILNTPNNPTGRCVDERTMDRLITLCQRHQIHLINDEEYLTDYGQSIASKADHTSAVSSLSKVYGFPGLRTGWFVGPQSIVKEMVNYRRYTTISNSHLCEQLACLVLDDYQSHLAHYHELVQRGLAILQEWVLQHPSLTLVPPQGTPFAYILMDDSRLSEDFVRGLLANERVLVMPAEVFESQQAIRVSFGRPPEILEAGLAAITRELKRGQYVKAA